LKIYLRGAPMFPALGTDPLTIKGQVCVRCGEYTPGTSFYLILHSIHNPVLSQCDPWTI
jgi:hypothetical protein